VKHRVEKQIGQSILSFETGHLAKQADATVVVQYGETVVINAVTSGPPRPGIDFFPLTCDYRERTAAAGKFPGGFIKREGRPTTKETLTSRLIDRPIRPLFPKGFNDEVQCQHCAGQRSAERLRRAGDEWHRRGAVRFALPFGGPLASVRIGRVDGQFVAFPTHDELEDSDLDLIVSGTEEAVAMIEGFAREMPENDMFEAILFGHSTIKEIMRPAARAGREGRPQKKPYDATVEPACSTGLRRRFYDEFKEAKQTSGKQARAEAVKALKERALAE
jgi:polyribonucleotide nucleotidyltransferase